MKVYWSSNLLSARLQYEKECFLDPSKGKVLYDTPLMCACLSVLQPVSFGPLKGEGPILDLFHVCLPVCLSTCCQKFCNRLAWSIWSSSKSRPNRWICMVNIEGCLSTVPKRIYSLAKSIRGAKDLKNSKMMKNVLFLHSSSFQSQCSTSNQFKIPETPQIVPKVSAYLRQSWT